MADPDEILTKRAIAGDREAQGHLWERERPWMAALLWSRTLDHDLTSDLLQEVAMVLVSKIQKLREPRALRGWLRQALLNRLRDELQSRLQGKNQSLDAELVQQLAADREPLDSDLYGELLAELPVDLREALVLRAVEGLSVTAVAEILEVNVTTVETRLVRGRKLLRERVERRQRQEEDPIRKVR